MKKKKKRKILIALGISLAAIAVLAFVLATALSRYVASIETQKEIRAIISEKLGPGVTFKRLDAAFLLRPHVVFEEVTVAVPGETTGTIGSIRLYPKLLPLLFGKIRLAKLVAVQPSFDVKLSESEKKEALQKKPVTFTEVNKTIGAILDSLRAVSPDLRIEVLEGTLSFKRSRNTVYIVKELSGRLQMIPGGFALDLAAKSGNLGALKASGRFFISGDRILANYLRLTVLDTVLSSSAVELTSSDGGLGSMDVALAGTIGQETAQWLSKNLNLAPEQTVRAPLTLTNGHVSWKPDSRMSLSGRLSVADGPSIEIEAVRNRDEIHVPRFVVEDTESKAAATFHVTRNTIDFSFQGNLNEKTLNRLFETSSFKRGWLRGTLHAHLPLNKLRESRFEGELDGSHLLLPIGLTSPIKVERLSLRARQRSVTVVKTAVRWADADYEVSGKVTAAPEGLRLDIDLSSTDVKVDKIVDEIVEAVHKPTSGEGDEFRFPPVTGVLRLHAKSGSYGRFSSSPLKADISLDESGVQMAFIETTVCGISLPGTWTIAHGTMHLDFRPQAVSQQLAPTLSCLTGKDGTQITGTFDLRGHLSTGGTSAELLSSLQGWARFTARDGEIQRYPLLARIFSVLNVTELLRGKLPEIGQKSLAYKTAVIRGPIKEGTFEIREAAIDGETTNVAAEGEVDIAEKKIDLTVLVAPFKTVDYIVSKIPLINIILGDTLISIPVRVDGNLDDPDVTILSPTAIGESLLGIMKRTIQLPFKVIEPILPDEKKKRDHAR